MSPSSLPGYHFLAFILQAILFCLHDYAVGLHFQWARTLGLGLCCMRLAPDEQVVFREVGSRYESMMGAGQAEGCRVTYEKYKGNFPCLVESSPSAGDSHCGNLGSCTYECMLHCLLLCVSTSTRFCMHCH